MLLASTKLDEARNRLGLTNKQMARLLGVALSTYEGWGQRASGVPQYIAHSVEAHLRLSDRELKRLMDARGI